VTSTPVLLTVIATFLIGQSTGEMTRAQYYRSLASQNQSKVGDQWGFYQAKRIRGQILEGNADLLLAQGRGRFSADTLPAAAREMVYHLYFLKRVLDQVPGKIVSAGDKKTVHELAKITEDLKTLLAEAEKSVPAATAALEPAADADNVQAALDALQFRPAKKIKAAKKPKDSESEQVVLLKEIVVDIEKRKPESDIAHKVLKLEEETLLQAIKDADQRADEVYRRGKSIENVLEEFDTLVDQQTALADEFQQIAGRVKLLISAPGLDSQRKPGADSPILLGQIDAVRGISARLQGEYKAARHAYSARRYEDDARSNKDLAFLYEVKVLLNSARSDKHLFRSKMFLFAMLVAQAGVTIATLAIAVRRKSVFWLLAALTGLIAIGFGAYVYLDLGPMPTF
jgi:hypothetical protein